MSETKYPQPHCRERRSRGHPITASSGETRVRFVETAHKLFLAQGYRKTTMSHVTAECRASKRTLYDLFPSKMELFAAVIEQHWRSMLALPGNYDGLELRVALERIFRIDGDAAADAERAAFLKLTIVEAAEYPEIGDLMRKLGGQLAQNLLADWLEAEKRAGRLFSDDTTSAATILMDMMFGTMTTKTAAGAEWSGWEERQRYMRRCIHIFVHGTSMPAMASRGCSDPVQT